MDLTAKKEILKNLKAGTLVTLTSGQTAIFKKLNRTRFLCDINGVERSISVVDFSKAGSGFNIESSAQHILQNKEPSEKKSSAAIDRKIIGLSLVCSAKFGDFITLTDGSTVRFF
ncbi:hypothetical protein [Domibacillus robiginosus]|uniref:hypothetical protein n=1 Tax=Domibacillus robiginosus TaxID=1071054 RepID=UPI00067C9FFF|nr:hypothetical protein [Domibacillus robiginosus]